MQEATTADTTTAADTNAAAETSADISSDPVQGEQPETNGKRLIIQELIVQKYVKNQDYIKAQAAYALGRGGGPLGKFGERAIF